MNEIKDAAHILIATPTFRGNVASQTVASLTALTELLLRRGINSTFATLDGADITIARNTLATYVHQTPQLTHLLFVDDDMVFDARIILEMLAASKDVVGAACPRREINLKQLFEGGKSGLTFDQAMVQSLIFELQHLPGNKIEIEKGVCPVARVGTGIMLIRRSILERLVAESRITSKRNATIRLEGLTNIHGFFDPIEPTSTEKMSEDYAFCERVRQAGGDVCALVTAEIGHVGSMVYRGRYLDMLRAGKA